jgi:hypothetical protein
VVRKLIRCKIIMTEKLRKREKDNPWFKCNIKTNKPRYTPYTSYMFWLLMWPPSGRCITKNTHIKILPKLLEPMQWYKVLNLKNNAMYYF